MTESIPAALRRLVVARAQEKCEYCLLSQQFSSYTHEVDHVIATKHGGQTIDTNLSLSCLPCNRYKGSDIATFDPESRVLVLLFNPCQQVWAEHFELENAQIMGKTATGRATVFLLKFNLRDRILQRQMLISQRLY